MKQTVTPPSSSGSARRRGYRGMSAEELSRQRRDRLVAAATALFGENGYAATPIDTICARARVSTRHFYEHFAGRESVLHAVYDTLVGEFEERVSADLMQGEASLLARVADTLEAAVHFMLDEPTRGRILCIEAVGVSPVMEKKRRQTTHDLAAIIDNYACLLVDNGFLPERDYHLPSIALVGMVNELIAEWLTENTGLTQAEMAHEAKLLFRAVILGAQHYEPSGSSDAPPRFAAASIGSP